MKNNYIHLHLAIYFTLNMQKRMLHKLHFLMSDSTAALICLLFYSLVFLKLWLNNVV